MLDYNRRLRAVVDLPLMNWDVVAMERGRHFLKFTVEQDLKMLSAYRNKCDWDISTDEMADLLSVHAYEALVLTDDLQHIQWVSEGFTAMTGYQPEEVIGHKPAMLQPEIPQNDDLERIRIGIQLQKPFTASVINLRKNGEEYRCKLEIYPLTRANNLVNFLALESEITE